MKISGFSLILAALVSTSVNAAPYNDIPFPKNVVTTKTWTYKTQSCSTSLGVKPCNGKVQKSVVTKKQTTRPTVYKTVTPTQYSTSTKTVTVKSTKTLSFTQTVTPVPNTETRFTTFDETLSITETSFTTVEEVSSFTETSITTLDETSTFTETTTTPSIVTSYDEVVVTVTETSNIPRETIPVPPGFKYPTPGTRTVRRKKRDAAIEARDEDTSVSRDGKWLFNNHAEDETSPAIKARSNKKYPQKVICTVYLGVIIPKTSTRTAKTKTIVKATKTSTRVSSVTTSKTITITLVPNTVTSVSSITETDSTTVTDTSSITETESTTTTESYSTTETTSVTTTITEASASPTTVTTTRTITETVAPEPTYVICGPSNIRSRGGVNDVALEWLAFNLGNGANPGEGATSPEECCHRCAENPNCVGSLYRYSTSEERWICQVSIANTCSANQGGQAGAYRFNRDTSAAVNTYISNGYCGTWDWF